MWIIRFFSRGPLLAAVFLAGLLGNATPSTASPQSAKDLLASGRVDEVIPVLQREINQFPNDAELHNLLCRAYFMTEDWDRGIAECERARNLAPQKSLYHLWLGRIYGEKADRVGFLSAAGMVKKVRSSFERAVELDPNSWEARTDLAEFYLEAPGIVGGGKDKAREQAKALLPLHPGMAHWVLARIAEKEKNIAEAEREYRAGIAATHGGSRAWLDFAIFLRHTNRFEEMEQALQQVESAPVDRGESLMDGASLLLQAGRYFPLGIRLVHRYFSVGPVEEGPAFKAHTYLGELLEKQGDRPGAAEEYRSALALFRGYRRAAEGLKRLEH
jgi:tetratricopeptide (TPR) repeat protein